MTGGKSPKRKGNLYEYEVRDWLREHIDPNACRVILSGALGSLDPSLHGDCRAYWGSRDMAVQCKRKANGIKSIDNELADHDVLFYRPDGDKEHRICMKASVLLEVLGK